MLPVQPITVCVYVFHIAGVYSTSCWLGDLLSGTDTQNRPFGIPKHPVCQSSWMCRVVQLPKENWGGRVFCSTHCHEAIWEWSVYCIYIYIYISICILKKFISSISTSGTVSHINIIVVHAKGQHWSNSKTSMHATRKVLWPSTTSVKNMQKKIYIYIYMYICIFVADCEPSTMNTMQVLYVARIQEVSRSRNGIWQWVRLTVQSV